MTREAALGFMILAAKMQGFDSATIKELKNEMKDLMDKKEESEAEEMYERF